MEKGNVILTASHNVGIGLWTSICIGFCAIFGKESQRLMMKQNSVANACKRSIQYQLDKLEGYKITSVKIQFSGKLSCTMIALAEPIK